MSVLELTEFLVKAVAKQPEEIEVKVVSDEEAEMVIEVKIVEDDMGRVIGKAGRTANSIRTLVQASSYLQDNKKIRVNIDAK